MSGLDISIEKLTKRFGDLSVLESANLEIEPGEFIVIIGKSGCGKSTLLRLIAGLEQATEGVIRFDDEPIRRLHPGVRMMFQDARLLPWQTVIKNVEIGVSASNGADALKALELVGLTEKQDEWPAVLSGGQKQRVALARALAGRPRLLLFDEPLGALDALTRLEMQNLIEKLWQQQRFTAVLVTHDVNEAIRLADRVILIEDGHISQNIKIDLPRPRTVNGPFADYHRMILNYLLHEKELTTQ